MKNIALVISNFSCLSLLGCWLLLCAIPARAEEPPPPPRIFHAKDKPKARKKARPRRTKKPRARKKKQAKMRAKKRAKPMRRQGAKIPNGAPMWRHLRRLGPRRYAMTPQAQRYYIQKLSYVKLKVLVDLHTHKGRTLGYALLYVSPKSPLRRLGLREKDVLLSVNGRPLRSTYQAMLAYWSLQKATRYKVRILRRRKVLVLTILIQ